MIGFPMHIKDATGLKKTISRAHPVPVEVRSLDEVISINDSVTDAANRNEHDIARATSAILRGIDASRNVELAHTWELSWAMCIEIGRAKRAVIWSAVGIGVLQAVLFILDKVI